MIDVIVFSAVCVSPRGVPAARVCGGRPEVAQHGQVPPHDATRRDQVCSVSMVASGKGREGWCVGGLVCGWRGGRVGV